MISRYKIKNQVFQSEVVIFSVTELCWKKNYKDITVVVTVKNSLAK